MRVSPNPVGGGSQTNKFTYILFPGSGDGRAHGEAEVIQAASRLYAETMAAGASQIAEADEL
jgi:hypothetical protein